MFQGNLRVKLLGFALGENFARKLSDDLPLGKNHGMILTGILENL